MENRIINIFGGKSLDHWSVICKLYKSVIFPRMPIEEIKKSGRGESMYLLSFSSKPKHVYSIIDEKVIMEADTALIELISKIKNIWTVRQIAKIDGYNFEIGDYNVRYGNLTVGSHSKGLIVEVEHTKSSSVTESTDLLIEFIDYLIPKELLRNYKLEIKRPDNGYDYTKVGLSQTKEHDDLPKKFNSLNESIIPNVKMEIDNPPDTINTNNINSSSNEVINTTSPYSNNHSSIMETPASLGSTVSNIVNETNKFFAASADSSVTVDTPMTTTTTNISNSLSSSLNTTSTLQSSIINTVTNGTTSPNTNSTSNTNTNTNASLPLKTNSLTSLNTTNVSTTESPTVGTPAAAASKPSPSAIKSTNPGKIASTPSVVPPMPSIAPNLLVPNSLTTALASLININAAVAANPLTTTDNTNYDININNLNTLPTAPTTTTIPPSQFLFNPLTNPLTASAASANLFNAAVNSNSIHSLPTMLNTNNNINTTANPNTITNTTITGKSSAPLPNVFSKSKQNSLLSSIKKKEPLLNQHLSSAQIANLLQSSGMTSYTTNSSTAGTSLKTLPPNSNILLNTTSLTLNANLMNSPLDTSNISEGKEIKEIKEHVKYNFTFTSRHTAYQYINLLRSEKIL